MDIDFTSPAYLKEGNEKQVRLYRVITKNGLFDLLKEFNPIVTGTIPIGIDSAQSDVDVSCYVRSQERFIEQAKMHFGGYEGFSINTKRIREDECVIIRFNLNGFQFELFGQQVESTQQFAFRHMLKEWEILKVRDSQFRLDVLQLKRDGYSTEEAFAKLLGISGDPYVELLNYSI